MRSVFFAMVTVVAPDDAHLQYWLISLAIMVSLIAQLSLTPYWDRVANRLETTQMCVLLFVVSLGVWFAEERDTGGVDRSRAAVITALLVAAVVAYLALLLCTAISAIYFMMRPEGGRRAHERETQDIAHRLTVVCKVVLSKELEALEQVLAGAPYLDRERVGHFANFFLLEAAGIQSAMRNMRRLPLNTKTVEPCTDEALARRAREAESILGARFQASPSPLTPVGGRKACWTESDLA